MVKYACEVSGCTYTSARRASLRRHVKSKHKRGGGQAAE